MICSKCGTDNRAKVRYCEECGSALAVTPSTSQANLSLLTWKPWRFLFQREFGSLAINNGHLDFVIQPQFTHPILTIIAKIMSWGIHPLSWFWLSGHSALKNLNVIAIWRVNWILWDMNFLFVFSSGFLGAYPIAAEQLADAQAFVAATKAASADAKYNLKG